MAYITLASPARRAGLTLPGLLAFRPNVHFGATSAQQTASIDVFRMGGAIATTVNPETGVRQPDRTLETGKKITPPADPGIRNETVVFPFPLDSSNHTRHTLGRLLKTLLHPWYDDRKTNEQKRKELPAYIYSHQAQQLYRLPHAEGPAQLVTHGTDTMVEAAALRAYLPLPRVTVWTGSWSSPGEPGSDARSNLANARLVAQDKNTPPGSYVVIGNEVHLATRLKAINTWPAHTFFTQAKPLYFMSYGDKPVGLVASKQRQVLWRQSYLEKLENGLGKDLPPLNKSRWSHLITTSALEPAYVERLRIEPAHGQNDARACAKKLKQAFKRLETMQKPVGLLLEGDLQDYPEEEALREQIKALRKKRVYVIESQRVNAALPVGFTLPAEQQRIKMSALLKRPGVAKQLEFWMSRNLAGEVVPHKDSYPFQIKEPSGYGAVIWAFPGLRAQQITDAFASLADEKDPQKKRLLLLGFGDGHVPIGPFTMNARLIKGFKAMGNDTLGKALVNSLQQQQQQLGSKASPSLITIEAQLSSLLEKEPDLLPESNRTSTSAKALLTKALAHSDPMLKALYEGIKAGYCVDIASQALLAKPNLQAYELGSILAYIGVTPYEESVVSKERFTKRLRSVAPHHPFYS